MPFWICDTCKNYVGCHHKTKNRTRPLGAIPSLELRQLRRQIHAVLDPLWESGEYTRTQLYEHISDALGREFHTAEIRTVAEAERILALVYNIDFNGIDDMAISLASISRNTTIAPPRIVLHGPQGVGKSSWAAAAPNPIFLPTEDGLGRLEVDAFPLLQSFDAVVEAIGALYQENHEYNTVVLDTADWLEPLIWKATCEANGWNNIEQPGFGKGYLAATEFWTKLFDGLNALRADRGCAIVVVAHSEIKRYNSPETEPYDRFSIKLQARAAAKLQEWADCVFFANFKTYTATTDAGFNKTVVRGVGTGERVLYTEERPAFLAKNRYSLPPEMSLNWMAFQEALLPQPKADESAAA